MVAHLAGPRSRTPVGAGPIPGVDRADVPDRDSFHGGVVHCSNHEGSRGGALVLNDFVGGRCHGFRRCLLNGRSTSIVGECIKESDLVKGGEVRNQRFKVFEELSWHPVSQRCDATKLPSPILRGLAVVEQQNSLG